jgi:ATP-dependent Clp protease ATP-binding subunit ClpA
MDMFDRFGEPARVVIFYALYIARGAKYITPEHILHAVIHKDPELFGQVAPEVPGLLENLKKEFCVEDQALPSSEKVKPLPLSRPAKDIILMADEQRLRLGHPKVEAQHLVLGILLCKRPFTPWFTRRTSHSKAQEVLVKHGLTASSLEARIRASTAL